MTSLNPQADIYDPLTLAVINQAFATEIRYTTPCRIGVSLDWDYCPDGVKIREYGLGQSGPLALNQTGRWVQPKSEAKLTRQFELRGLSDLKVLKFVGTEDDHALIDFMSVYGMIGGSFETGVSEQPLDRIRRRETDCKRCYRHPRQPACLTKSSFRPSGSCCGLSQKVARPWPSTQRASTASCAWRPYSWLLATPALRTARTAALFSQWVDPAERERDRSIARRGAEQQFIAEDCMKGKRVSGR